MQKSNPNENNQIEKEWEPILIEDIIFNNKDDSFKSTLGLYHKNRDTEVIVEKKHTLEYPQLDTILIVEYFIKKYSDHYTKKALWRKLPTDMTFDTFLVIFDYLAESCKISINPEGKIRWLGNPVPGRK